MMLLLLLGVAEAAGLSLKQVVKASHARERSDIECLPFHQWTLVNMLFLLCRVILSPELF